MHRRYTYPVIVCLFVIASLGLSLARAADGEGHLSRLEDAVQRAVAVLQDPQLSSLENREKRREMLRDIVYPEFDFAQMSSGAVGHKWHKFSDDQKSRFVALFKQLLENTYLNMVEKYQGEKVTFLKEVRLDSHQVRVDSVILSKGQKYDISYRLEQVGDDWKVCDVIIAGVSVVANYRAQFSQLLRQGSSDVEQLIAKLADKVAKASH